MSRSCDSRASVRSCDSRLSQLSQRSCSRTILSSVQIEELRIAAKRHEIKKLMKENKKRGRQAILCPQSTCPRRSLSLTVPREFTLSCPATPSRSYMSDADSDCEEGRPWSRSLRSSRAPSPSRAYRPELTVPHAPSLRTEHRSRSSSAFRAASGTPSKRSMSRHRLPREQAAIERHMERTSTAQASLDDTELSVQSNRPGWNDSTRADSQDGVSKLSKDLLAPRSRSDQAAPGDNQSTKQQAADLDDLVRVGATPEERAKRARELAQRKHNERAEKAAAVKCFTGAKTQPVPRQGRSGHPGSSHSASQHRQLEAAKQTAQ